MQDRPKRRVNISVSKKCLIWRSGPAQYQRAEILAFIISINNESITVAAACHPSSSSVHLFLEELSLIRSLIKQNINDLNLAVHFKLDIKNIHMQGVRN